MDGRTEAITISPSLFFKKRGDKYARFLKIENVALYQERTILIVSKFQYTQCIGSRPVKLKPIFRGISSEWYLIFVSYNFIV